MQRINSALVVLSVMTGVIYSSVIMPERKMSPWALTGKMFTGIFVEDVWVRDRYSKLELTIAVNSKLCQYSVDLKPISQLFNVKFNKASIPETFTRYDTKLTVSFDKAGADDLRKRIEKAAKGILKPLPCSIDDFKYMY